MQLEIEEISFLHVIKNKDLYMDPSWGIKAGDIIKITPITKVCMVKKIGVEALYKDTDGISTYLSIYMFVYTNNTWIVNNSINLTY